jgi:hypothetical protein
MHSSFATLEQILFILLGAILFIVVKYLIKCLCWKHFRRKRLKPYAPYDGQRFCSKCLEEEANPKVICSCGWKGRFLELMEYAYSEDTMFIYHCPDCEKEIKF